MTLQEQMPAGTYITGINRTYLRSLFVVEHWLWNGRAQVCFLMYDGIRGNTLQDVQTWSEGKISEYRKATPAEVQSFLEFGAAPDQLHLRSEKCLRSFQAKVSSCRCQWSKHPIFCRCLGEDL